MSVFIVLAEEYDEPSTVMGAFRSWDQAARFAAGHERTMGKSLIWEAVSREPFVTEKAEIEDGSLSGWTIVEVWV